nr:MAG TPA: hypothetical protein [Caudoviricetes sp.]
MIIIIFPILKNFIVLHNYLHISIFNDFNISFFSYYYNIFCKFPSNNECLYQ